MNLPRAIICDLDMTLADCSHRLHFVDGKYAGCIPGLEPADYGRPSKSYWCKREPPHEKFIPDYESFYAAMGKDKVNESISFILEQNASCINCEMVHPEFTPIFVTGRPEKYREVTQKWLDRNLMGGRHTLFMRPDYLTYLDFYVDSEGHECWSEYDSDKPDHRPSTEVKKEIYEREIAGNYDVLFAIDDSEDVCQMWKGLGLTVLKIT